MDFEIFFTFWKLLYAIVSREKRRESTFPIRGGDKHQVFMTYPMGYWKQ